MVGKDGIMEWKSQAGLLYTDDVCLMANSEEDMKVIMGKVNECVVEYGLKVNEKKSVLGPLKLCVYLLPLSAIFIYHKTGYHVYADDTQLYISFKCKQPLEEI